MKASNFDKLMARCATLRDLGAASNVLGWDEMCYMPEGGAEVRGRATATIRQLHHKTLTSAAMRRLLTAAEQEVANEPNDSDRVVMVRLMREDVERASKLKPAIVAAEATAQTTAYAAWAKAKQSNDFGVFAQPLSAMVDLQRRKADQYGFSEHPLNALLPDYDSDVSVADLQRIFGAFKPELVAFLRSLGNHYVADRSCLHKGFPPALQSSFAHKMMANMGLDMTRVRLDYAQHPFMSPVSSPFDTRMTYRKRSSFELLSVIHEGGHALFEQGIDPKYDGTPLGVITSSTVHESQSRTWENIVARGRAYWTHWYPRLQRTFARQLKDVSLDTFLGALNNVQPGFIRVQADELHYNLHIILRFELELDLMSGAVPVAKLPQVWSDRFESMFGIRPSGDADGCLQDIHWSGGSFGYFPSYSLGNLLASQLFEKALSDVPGLEEGIAKGNCLPLRQWQLDNVHRHGRKYGANELARRITGSDLNHAAFMRYAKQKFAV